MDDSRLKTGFRYEEGECTMHFSYPNGCSVRVEFNSYDEDEDLGGESGWVSAKWAFVSVDIPDDCDMNTELLQVVDASILGGLAQFGKDGVSEGRFAKGDSMARISIDGLGAVLSAVQHISAEVVNEARVNK